MIPCSLSFSGIRDYPATVMDLSGRNQHVLITGPNGAGKSTITYCMGAVLYSSKVDLEGLKSRNLPADQTWKAQISFLFENDGAMKIDAPDYIQFVLKIVQEPGQPIKKEFFISSGDVVGQWGETTRYSSGDSRFSFTAYKNDLMYKYKVDPDQFYLIWYQQEVNQFAVMNPEERFRIFSEMHGIDKVQRDWESSMETMKETKETLRSAEINLKNSKMLLGIKKQELYRYEDNQKRLKEGGMRYAKSLLHLEGFYTKEQKTLQLHIQELEDQLKNNQDEFVEKRKDLSKMQELLKSFESKHKCLQTEIENHEENIEEKKAKSKELKKSIEELEDELKEITEKSKQLTRTEEQVKKELSCVDEKIRETKQQKKRLGFKIKEIEQLWSDKITFIAELRQQIKQDEKFERIHKERLQQYGSSHHVQERIDNLYQTIQRQKDEQSESSKLLSSLREELQMLEEEKDLSIRQSESINYVRSKNMQVYPLRELVELDHTAKLKDEERFNTIKYSIFFDGSSIMPPNDLYHVPLRKIVPDRSLTALPDLHLRIKEGLVDEKIPYAMKVLWWIEQFFKKDSYVMQNGALIDPMGIRGPQEKERYILSAKALQTRKQEVGKMINDLNEKIEKLVQAIERDTKTWQELNGIIHSVKQAEAFMTNEHERVTRINRLEAEIAKTSDLSENKKKLQDSETRLMKQGVELDYLERKLREEAEFYEKLGELKGRYDQLNDMRVEHSKLSEYLKKQSSLLNDLYESQEKLEDSIRKAEQQLRKMEDELEAFKRDLDLREKQKSSKQDEREVAQNRLVEVIREIEEVKTLIPQTYTKAQTFLEDKPLPSLPQMREDLESGKIIFRQARNEEGIDPSAPENYRVIKEETDRLEEDYRRTSILLEQDEERAEKLKDQLETTINMRVLELQQRFTSYMSQFQFEGEISWESFEDKRHRTHFNLYIKARKEGHRGALEDVSVKARGGKVGKGVSGGEESLSSLLFALVLLQNLQTTPGFIVLDEFDSALDENRKLKVFDLYGAELKRKLIILTPKSHEESYLGRFSKAFVVQHDPTVPRSKVVGLIKV